MVSSTLEKRGIREHLTAGECLGVLFYKIILDLCYYFFEYEFFSYTGFDFEFSTLKYVLCWILYLAVYAMIRSRKSDICSLFVYVIYALSIVPFLVFYQFSNKCELWMLILQIVCLILMKWAFSIFPVNWKVPFKKISYRSFWLRISVHILLIVYLGYTIMKYGLPRLDVMFSPDISDVRAEVSLSTLDNIIQTLICKIVCPLFIILSFKEKKYLSFAMGVLIQLYTYGVTGFKTYLFIPIVFFGLNMFPKLKIKRMVFGGLAALFCVLSLWTIISQNAYLYALLGDRVVFFPAIIKYSYFDFFSKNEFAYFSQSSIAGIFNITSNYTENIPNMIGRVYFNMPEMWTNTGFMADGYSNAGVIGVLSMSLLIAIVLSLTRNEIRKCSATTLRCLEALLLTYYVALNDGPAISTLFSGGLIFVLFMVMFISFDDDQESKALLPKKY